MQLEQDELPAPKPVATITCPDTQEETSGLLQRKTVPHMWVGYSHVVVLMSICNRSCSLVISNSFVHRCLGAESPVREVWQQGGSTGTLFRAFAFLFSPDLF